MLVKIFLWIFSCSLFHDTRLYHFPQAPTWLCLFLFPSFDFTSGKYIGQQAKTTSTSPSSLLKHLYFPSPYHRHCVPPGQGSSLVFKGKCFISSSIVFPLFSPGALLQQLILYPLNFHPFPAIAFFLPIWWCLYHRKIKLLFLTLPLPQIMILSLSIQTSRKVHMVYILKMFLFWGNC